MPTALVMYSHGINNQKEWLKTIAMIYDYYFSGPGVGLGSAAIVLTQSISMVAVISSWDWGHRKPCSLP